MGIYLCFIVKQKGKLSGKTISVKYDLEYGQDVFEMQENSIQPGQKVVIVDDVIATGGSCEAAIQLVNKLNAEVVECVMLVELAFLDYKKKVKAKTTSFIKFDS